MVHTFAMPTIIVLSSIIVSTCATIVVWTVPLGHDIEVASASEIHVVHCTQMLVIGFLVGMLDVAYSAVEIRILRHRELALASCCCCCRFQNHVMREFEVTPVLVLGGIRFFARLAMKCGIMNVRLYLWMLDCVVSVFDGVHRCKMIQIGGETRHDLAAAVALIVVVQLAYINSCIRGMSESMYYQATRLLL